MPDASGGGGALGGPPSKGQDWLASTNVGGASGGGGATGGVTGGGATGGVTGGGATTTGGGTDLASLLAQLQTAVAALQTALEGSGLLGTPPVTGGGAGTGAPSGCGCGGSMVQQSPQQMGGANGAVDPRDADRVPAQKPKKQHQAAAGVQAAEGAEGLGRAPAGFKIVNPLPGARTSSKYGEISSVRGGRPHSGHDLAKSQGSTIGAAAAGRVSKVVSEKDGGSYGNYIEIDHGNGWVTRYAHMVSRSPLEVGQTVSPGQAIGKVGSTGNSTGPHLHFEVLKNGAKQNPEPFLNGEKTF